MEDISEGLKAEMSHFLIWWNSKLYFQYDMGYKVLVVVGLLKVDKIN